MTNNLKQDSEKRRAIKWSSPKQQQEYSYILGPPLQVFVPSRQRSDDLASSPSTASSAVGRSLCLQESYASTHMRTRLTARVCSTRRHAGPAVTACRRHDWWPWGLESSVVHGVARASCTPPARATIILLLKAFRSRSGPAKTEQQPVQVQCHGIPGEARRLDTGGQAPLIAKALYIFLLVNPVNTKKTSHRILEHIHGVLNEVYL